MNQPPERTGTDPTGNILIRIDDGGRVRGVTISRLEDDQRSAVALNDAVRRAYVSARTGGAGTTPRSRDPERRLPPVAEPGPRPPRIAMTHPWTAGREIHMPDFAEAKRVLAVRTGRVSGTSSNDCVTVTLDPGSSLGTIECDAAWLSLAQPKNAAQALEEAFRHAYKERNDD